VANETKAARHRLAPELGDRLGQRIAKAGIDVSVGADREQASLRERVREELQQQEGRRVCRV
jgi:hypothetical protein